MLGDYTQHYKQSTQRYNPEDSHLQNVDNPKS
jgi:hypothetical protein